MVDTRAATADEVDEEQPDRGGDHLDREGGGVHCSSDNHLPLLDQHHLLISQVNLGHALFFAALLARLPIVQTLLEKGAKVVII